jgi:hypothetical protein
MYEHHHTISGEEKAVYLNRLDSALSAVITNLWAVDDNSHFGRKIRPFGEKEKWDFGRLPKETNTNRELARLTELVKREYSWLGWHTSSSNPTDNYGYFEDVNISAESGLPWVFDHIRLHETRKNAPELLSKIPQYDDLSKQLTGILEGDMVPLDEVKQKADGIHKEAMRRNYLERLGSSTLIGWEKSRYSLEPEARLSVKLGAESLWRITYVRYMPDSSMFELGMIDLWQDNLKPEIKLKKDGKGELSGQFAYKLNNFSKENPAWYILYSIDDLFEGLHPVHVSRAIVGPFENRYLTKAGPDNALQVAKEILDADRDFSLLRFSRQYSFAPNHIEQDGRINQLIYRENWSEEIIACPSAYASRVASSVLGEDVKILGI